MVINYNERVFGLDLLRTLAIVLVLLSHSTLLIFPNTESLWLTVIQFFGTVGVDLFFVLSGYLVGNMLLRQVLKGKTKLKDFVYFWVRRWFRTLPNYIVILLLNIVLLAILKGEVIDELVLYVVFLQNFSSPHPNFFTEAWSLSIEEYAYIIGPLLLFILLQTFKKTKQQQLYVVTVVFVIGVVTLARIHFNFNHELESLKVWSGSLRKVVVYRIDSVYYGFLAAFLMWKYGTFITRHRRLIGVLGVLLFAVIHGLIFIRDWTPVHTSSFFNIYYLPLLSMSMLATFPVMVRIDISGFLKVWVTKLSVLSYGVYLVNYSLILLTIQHYIDVASLSNLLKIGLVLFYWFCSIGCAYVLYVYFEKPVMDLRDSPLIKSKFTKSN